MYDARIEVFNQTRLATVVLLVCVGTCCVVSVADNVLEETVVYASGEGGYNTYRIPALLTLPDGTLLAFAEARKFSLSDTGPIDLVLKHSTDDGNTWSAMQTVWADGNTCGNPCPVLDETTGVVHLLLTHNLAEDKERAIIRKEAKGTRTVWTTRSRDNGHTWEAPREITESAKQAAWGWYATGPGVGIQLRYGPHAGRLVIPCDHTYDDPGGAIEDGPYSYGSHIIFSDDHGETWQPGGVVRPQVNECQVVELADGKGTLLLDMRAYFGKHRRAQSRSMDGGMTWSMPENQPDLIEPVCQASLLRYSWPERDVSGRLLFANPASERRVNMTVRASCDDGATWPASRTVWEGPSAYCCLARLGDGRIGLLYERGVKMPYETIILARFPLSWLEKSTEATQ